MVTLNCPLCCNETFSTPSSLKCHILNIANKLLCPWCRHKFQTLMELADHLETNCFQHSTVTDKVNQEFEEFTKRIDVNPDSILARALLGNPRESTKKGDIEESQYYCQMCGVHIDEVEEHLKQFHEGQEIVLEEEGIDDFTGNLNDGHTILIIDPEENDEGDEEEIEEKKTVTASIFSSTNNKFNTISELEVKDKEGRLYTRKFVKIDKFWLQDEDKTQKSTPSDELSIETGNNQLIELNKCSVCNLYFTSPEECSNHTCIEQLECPLTFTDSEPLNDHHSIARPKEESNSSKKNLSGPFNCEVCNTTFPTFKSLRLHKRMHEPIKSREIDAPSKYGLLESDVSEEQIRQMFICKICNKTYDKQYENIHMNSHNAANNGFNCDVCNRKFFTRAHLDMHMKAHSNNKKFTCSYCKKPFVTYDGLNEHLLNQCQRRPYACRFCGRRFARPHEKVKHERIHTGEKPHVCDICGKAFRVSYCLTLHLRTHSGTRPYQCKHCGKRFKSHSVYNHHTLTHSDVRAYQCPYCPKAFKTSVQLAGHKNSHIKPFTCTECNRPFASLYAVRAHMETHKRDNNLKYDCWMCGALYSRAFALRDHLKQQHQQVEGEKGKAVVALSVEEEMEATNSILVAEDDIILGLDGASNIEIIENEGE